MKIRQRDIVLINYPFSDLQGSKVRPALVVSNDYYNQASADAIMVPLTSVIKNEPYSILVSQKDMASGNLIKPSRIKMDKVFSVETRLVRMRIGSLKEQVFESVKEKIFSAIR